MQDWTRGSSAVMEERMERAVCMVCSMVMGMVDSASSLFLAAS